MQTPQSQSVSAAHALVTQTPRVASQRELGAQAASEVQRQPCTSPVAPQVWLAPHVQAPVSQVSGAQPWTSAPFLAAGSQCVCATEQVQPSVAHDVAAQPLASMPVRVSAQVRPTGHMNPSAQG